MSLNVINILTLQIGAYPLQEKHHVKYAKQINCGTEKTLNLINYFITIQLRCCKKCCSLKSIEIVKKLNFRIKKNKKNLIQNCTTKNYENAVKIIVFEVVNCI